MSNHSVGKLLLGIILCLCGLYTNVLSQELGFIESKIVQIVAAREDVTTREQRGRAFLMLDPTHEAMGVCTNTLGLLEFDTAHESFNYVYQTALIAHTSSLTVQLVFDDGFGPQTECRIIQIRVLAPSQE